MAKSKKSGEKSSGKKSGSSFKKKLKSVDSKYWMAGVAVLILLVAAGFFMFSDTGFLSNENLNSEEAPGTSDEVLVEVNDEEITSGEVDNMQQSYEQQGQQISEKEAVEELVTQELVLQEAREKEDMPTTEEVEDFLEDQLGQQGASLEDYKDMVESQGMSYEEEVENMKESILVQDYVEKIMEEKDIEASQEEIDQAYSTFEQQLESMPEEQRENITEEELQENAKSMVEQQKQQEVLNSFVEDLKEDADIEYLEDIEEETEQTAPQEGAPQEEAEEVPVGNI